MRPENIALLSGGRIARGGFQILRDLDLGFPPRSLTIVSGPNGSGKSTLLSVLAGLHPLDSGTLSVTTGVRRAFVPQRSEAEDTLPMTVADVVGMGRWFGPRWRNREEDRSIVSTCLDAVGLTGLEKRMLGELSGGQRQRTFLAQGLAQQADFLLLDEPTSGLDADGTVLLAASVASERARGAAVVLVTHDQTIARGSARHIRIAGGTASLRG